MTSPLYRSRFNYVVARADGAIAYNARTGAIAAVAPEVRGYLEAQHNSLCAEDEQDLLQLGFLHAGNEFEQVIQAFQNGKKEPSALRLTIAPTLACNKSCTYCYQNDYRSERVMSPETQETMLRYVGTRVAEGWRDVSCTWYGGEPLLAADIVERMSIGLRQVVTNAGGMMRSLGLITNATLLDRKMLQRLVRVGVEFAQISIDALVDEGPETRGVLAPTGEPSVILRNAVAAAARMKVALRINVTRSNAQDIPAIRSVLRDHGLDQYVSLARTCDLTTESQSVTESVVLRRGGCPELPLVRADTYAMARAEFARFEQNSFLSDAAHYQALVTRLTPRPHFCGATAGTLFVIDPDGDISRCWSSAGVATERIGSVYDLGSDMSASAVAKKWDEVSPFLNRACSRCKVLPLCMGGCAYPRLFARANQSQCESIRYQIRFAVETIAQIIRIPKNS